MPIEIGVNSKLTASHDLMKTSPVKPGIRYQVINARNIAQKFEEGNGIQVIKQQPGRAPKGRLGRRRELYLLRIIEALPLNLTRFREFLENTIQQSGIEEIVEDNMRKGLRIEICRVSRLFQLLHSRKRQERVESQIAERLHTSLAKYLWAAPIRIPRHRQWESL
jgi:hypothetical protein